MIVESISKTGIERAIENIISAYNKGKNQDTVMKLTYVLSLLRKYADDMGVKITIQYGAQEIRELLLPYFKQRNDDYYVSVGTFGVNTSIFDIYDLSELVENYAKESTLVATPDKSLDNEMVVYQIPLKKYYEVMQQYDYKIEELKRWGLGGAEL